MSPPVRTFGAYVDGPYAQVATPDGPRVAPDPADYPFLSFVCEVGEHFDGLVIFGRDGDPEQAQGRNLLPAHAQLAPLPHYTDLRRIGQVVRAAGGTARGFWRGLGRTDVVWVFGPHPFSFVLVLLAVLRRRRVVLGVRQDTVEYFRSRLPSGRWKPVLLAAGVLDAAFRVLARPLRTIVVGSEIERRYGGPRDGVLPVTISLVRSADVVDAPASRDWDGEVTLLTVGRVDREKNPLLLVEALAELERRRPGGHRLIWVGTGPMEDEVRRRAQELGVAERISMRGFVPFGPELLGLYRDAHAFVHVSLTEGVPAVLIEALASGTPVVATDVGGVGEALDGGAAGLLVPPADREALVGAILALASDGEGRDERARRGLELARERSLDVQAARVARFCAGTR
jgi:glycosyltransferase involved in cell wall biosynthesis